MSDTEGVLISLKEKFAPLVESYFNSQTHLHSTQQNENSLPINNHELEEFNEMKIIKSIFDHELENLPSNELEAVRLKLETKFPDPVQNKTQADNIDDNNSDVEFIDETKPAENINEATVEQTVEIGIEIKKGIEYKEPDSTTSHLHGNDPDQTVNFETSHGDELEYPNTMMNFVEGVGHQQARFSDVTTFESTTMGQIFIEFPLCMHVNDQVMQLDKLNRDETQPQQPSYEESTKILIAKKTITPKHKRQNNECFGARGCEDKEFDPKMSVVKIGAVTRRNYVKNYLKLPDDKTKLHREDLSDKKTQLFEDNEEVRKKIVANAAQKKAHSAPSLSQGTSVIKTRSKTDLVFLPFNQKKVYNNFNTVKLMRIEIDPAAKRFYDDFVAREALQRIKFEPVEKVLPRRISSNDEREVTVHENIEWEAEDGWDNLLEEVQQPSSSQNINSAKKRGSGGTSKK